MCLRYKDKAAESSTEIIATCSENYTQHTRRNILYGLNVEIVYVIVGGTYSNHYVWKSYIEEQKMPGNY
jgi:hypothetical protein